MTLHTNISVDNLSMLQLGHSSIFKSHPLQVVPLQPNISCWLLVLDGQAGVEDELRNQVRPETSIKSRVHDQLALIIKIHMHLKKKTTNYYREFEQQ